VETNRESAQFYIIAEVDRNTNRVAVRGRDCCGAVYDYLVLGQKR
jgi:hypothetical protein